MIAHGDPEQLALSLEARPEESLPGRLYRVGLRSEVKVTLTRNRQVLVSLTPTAGLRLHAGYAWAPDDVLRAIVTFISPGVLRVRRMEARRLFLRFPVELHAPSREASSRRAMSDEHLPHIARLERLHQILNDRHFAGVLRPISIRISDGMRRRLGEYALPSSGRSAEIVLSHRHIRRDGWQAATQTLLHEMVHQWQYESGRPVDHGSDFRARAREVGIPAAATVPAAYLHSLAGEHAGEELDLTFATDS